MHFPPSVPWKPLIIFQASILNISSWVKPSFILSNLRRPDYTFWYAIPICTRLLLQVSSHWGTVVYFHIPPLASCFPHQLLQTLEDRHHSLFMFLSQHSVSRSFMPASNLPAAMKYWSCLGLQQAVRPEDCMCRCDEVGGFQPEVRFWKVKVWGLFFKGCGNTLEGWSRDLTWADLFY